jgi:hypothetical protein
MANYSLTTIARRATGIRRIAGTDWLIENVAQREQRGNDRPTWILLKSLCNGTCASLVQYPTKRALLAALNG